MDPKKITSHIVTWLTQYSEQSKTHGFVVGISGGIDSAVTSTLCALSQKKVMVLNMPIRQFKNEFDRSTEHIRWLKSKFNNVESVTLDLSAVLECYEKSLPEEVQDFLTMANTRARIRMSCLYAFASHNKLLVAGTGNKIEDFGVGFFTKYGDGGVDISPIADLYKTEVFTLGRHFGISNSILQADPTDGLFADGRSDEAQIGASYPELEWAMDYSSKNESYSLSPRQQNVLEIYRLRNRANRHKMEAIPVCVVPEELKKD